MLGVVGESNGRRSMNTYTVLEKYGPCVQKTQNQGEPKNKETYRSLSSLEPKVGVQGEVRGSHFSEVGRELYRQ